MVTAAKDSTVPKGVPTAGMLATVPLASLDPVMDWKVPADGEYSVCLRDLYGGSVFGLNRRYELIVAARSSALASHASVLSFIRPSKDAAAAFASPHMPTDIFLTRPSILWSAST